MCSLVAAELDEFTARCAKIALANYAGDAFLPWNQPLYPPIGGGRQLQPLQQRREQQIKLYSAAPPGMASLPEGGVVPDLRPGPIRQRLSGPGSRPPSAPSTVGRHGGKVERSPFSYASTACSPLSPFGNDDRDPDITRDAEYCSLQGTPFSSTPAASRPASARGPSASQVAASILSQTVDAAVAALSNEESLTPAAGRCSLRKQTPMLYQDLPALQTLQSALAEKSSCGFGSAGCGHPVGFAMPPSMARRSRPPYGIGCGRGGNCIRPGSAPSARQQSSLPEVNAASMAANLQTPGASSSGCDARGGRWMRPASAPIARLPGSQQPPGALKVIAAATADAAFPRGRKTERAGDLSRQLSTALRQAHEGVPEFPPSARDLRRSSSPAAAQRRRSGSPLAPPSRSASPQTAKRPLSGRTRGADGRGTSLEAPMPSLVPLPFNLDKMQPAPPLRSVLQICQEQDSKDAASPAGRSFKSGKSSSFLMQEFLAPPTLSSLQSTSPRRDVSSPTADPFSTTALFQLQQSEGGVTLIEELSLVSGGIASDVVVNAKSPRAAVSGGAEEPNEKTMLPLGEAVQQQGNGKRTPDAGTPKASPTAKVKTPSGTSQSGSPATEGTSTTSDSETDIEADADANILSSLPVVKLFLRFSSDGEIHRDMLMKALELGGVSFLSDDLISEVLQRMSTPYTTLNLDEFKTFFRVYKRSMRELDETVFRKYDADGSGSISAAELGLVFEELNIAPMEHVVVEILAELDSDASGTLELSEFQHMMDLLRQREGFSKFEYQRLMSAFSIYDRNNNDMLDYAEFSGILSYLYYSIDRRVAIKIAQDNDVDGSGMLSRCEFLTCMRHIRDLEVDRISSLLQKLEGRRIPDARVNHVLNTTHGCLLHGLMEYGGYQVDTDALGEVAEECKIEVPAKSLTLSQAWCFMEIFRAREGCTKQEAQNVKEAFEKFASPTVGKMGQRGRRETVWEVGIVQAALALRWLGYPPQHEVLNLYMRDLDVDCLGKIDLPKFMKLVRKFREQDLADTMKAVEQRMERRHNLAKEDITDARMTRYFMIRGAIEATMKRRTSFREHEGFSPSEVYQLKRVFAKYDREGIGAISREELRMVCEDFLPELATSKELRPKLVSLLNSVDEGNENFSFLEFLRLMRSINSMRHQERLEKEERVIQEIGMAPADVQGFREIFVSLCKTGHEALHFDDVRMMLHTLTPLGDKLVHKLRQVWRAIGKEGEDSQLELAHFLMLMQRLMDMNFANINELTTKGSSKRERLLLATRVCHTQVQVSAAFRKERREHSAGGHLSRHMSDSNFKKGRTSLE
eukprot:TRINITY_DN20470_c0_g1_i2.p1 TRINITY_DN20470_c0_g1~~TRINITY_DN20470_c0_g1_i2.p1  ORF type:complete len:1315 (-),score=281.61 TRINITY_DN20470_c0_g1_i2:107-4051(-)